MTTFSPYHFRSSLILAAFVLTTVATQAAALVSFDIPAQPAPAALKLFTQQAGAQVVYVHDDLTEVTTQGVKGDFLPAEALERLLSGTGLSVEPTGSGNFAISRVATTGSIQAVVRESESGRHVIGAKVTIANTDKVAFTDKRGRFTLENVPAGDYELWITAEGTQDTKVTDIVIKPGHRHSLSVIEVPVKQPGVMELDPYVVSAKKNDGVIELDAYEVSDQRAKPFVVGNMDIPRSINDAQPYYIFDAKVIDQSGATNVEDFLKQRLTMNTSALSNAQAAGGSAGASRVGNTSTINLRGLGQDKTLILVDGRRMAAVNTGFAADTYQSDLNGIPVSAIDRIEVLPSSASGIYGGSAIGGVVNVVLKRNYRGGEIRTTYDNTFESDSAARSVSASYGFTLEDGRTHIMLNGSWSQGSPLLLRDRRAIVDRNIAAILRNSPAFIYSNTNAWLGSLPNIYPASSSQTTLTLKGGAGVINSRRTYVAPGTSQNTSTAELNAGLLANAGQWNMDLPETTQVSTGLRQAFGVTPEVKSVRASIRRQMLPKLEFFADFSYSDNKTEAVFNPFTAFYIPSYAPTNPFTTAVYVRFPDATEVPTTTSSLTRNTTFGALAQLPWGWVGEVDYSWSRNRYSYLYYDTDATAEELDIENGVLNPFVDTLRHPLALSKYYSPQAYAGSTELDSIAARASGALPQLPWGQPKLTIGLEHRIEASPERAFTVYPSITVADRNRTVFYERKATTNSVYAEATVPLLKSRWLPGIETLELQLAGRQEDYEVDTGTARRTEYFERNPVLTFYQGPTLNGLPYFSKDSYKSTNFTLGVKYQPTKEVIVRVSKATAFLPPRPDQLVMNPQQSSFASTVIDRRTGNPVSVFTLSGGNPDLKPQNSKSFNAGIIWEPTGELLRGLRLNAEYYRVEQFDYITALGAQGIVDQESRWPGRVTRNGSGMITLVDTSSLNLYRQDTAGWDLSASYERKTAAGLFTLSATQSIVDYLKTQYAQNKPEYDTVNFPSEGGATKYKFSGNLSWQRENWSAGWSTRYFSAYKQYGATGGYTATLLGSPSTVYINPQGGDRIPSQIYHDAYVGYTFGNRSNSGTGLGKSASALLSNVSVQLGIRNVFAATPPFDAFYTSNYYTSPYGDMRLRSYWVSLRKQF